MLKCKTRPGYTPEGKQNVVICTVPDDDMNYVDNIAYEILRYYNCAVWYETYECDASAEDVSLPEDISLFVVPGLNKDININELVKYNPALIDRKGISVIIHTIRYYDNDTGFEEYGIAESDFYHADNFLEITDVLFYDDSERLLKAAYDVYVYVKSVESEKEYAKQIAPLKDSSVFTNFSRKLVRYIYDDMDKYAILHRYLNSSGFEMMSGDINFEDILPVRDARREGRQEIYILNQYDQEFYAGYAYYKDAGEEEDRDKVLKFFSKADMILENLLPAGSARKEDMQKIIMSGSEDGDVHNLFVGYAYYKGIGVEKDRDKALKFLSKAADDGYTEAMELLSRLYSSYECDRSHEAEERRHEIAKRKLDAYKLRYKQDYSDLSAGLLADAAYGYFFVLKSEYEDIERELSDLRDPFGNREYTDEELEEEIKLLNEDAEQKIMEIDCVIEELEKLRIMSSENKRVCVSNREYIDIPKISVKDYERIVNEIKKSEYLNHEDRFSRSIRRRERFDIYYDIRMNTFNGKPDNSDKFYMLA